MFADFGSAFVQTDYDSYISRRNKLNVTIYRGEMIFAIDAPTLEMDNMLDRLCDKLGGEMRDTRCPNCSEFVLDHVIALPIAEDNIYYSYLGKTRVERICRYSKSSKIETDLSLSCDSLFVSVYGKSKEIINSILEKLELKPTEEIEKFGNWLYVSLYVENGMEFTPNIYKINPEIKKKILETPL